MLADTPAQVPLLKAQILKNDAADPQGTLIAEVLTVADLLPGTIDEQRSKIAILDRIRDRLTPAVLSGLSASDRADVDGMTPPTTLRPLGPSDLPALFRRRFTENNGTVGTVFYVKYRNDVVLSDGHNLSFASPRQRTTSFCPTARRCSRQADRLVFAGDDPLDGTRRAPRDRRGLLGGRGGGPRRRDPRPSWGALVVLASADDGRPLDGGQGGLDGRSSSTS